MDKSPKYTFSELLKQFRAREDITQQELAERVPVHRNTIVTWENGSGLPKTRPAVEALAQALHLSEEETTQLLRAAYWEPSGQQVEKTAQQVKPAEVPHPLLWNLPYRRNPFFTGRGAILKQLHETLTASKKAALTQLQAISGLGGIGKTQTAIEYAYRYRKDYQAVLWARADTAETLIADLVNIAGLLGLPEKDEQDRSRVVTAVKRWLQEARDWLLILDNVDDLALAYDFLPAQYGGHVLLTTREQVIGTLAPQIKLSEMTLKEGAFFLLHRVKLIAPDTQADDIPEREWKFATAIVKALAGLPLALDQAGAYIEETACGLAGYLKRYELYHSTLLKQRGKGPPYDHPESVASTWSLSFERVEQSNHAAAELLHLCAFLHPDGIPEEVIIEGAAELGPELAPVAADLLQLDAAIGVLRRFSLLRRDEDSRSGHKDTTLEHHDVDTQSLTIHRLVQAVLKDAMEEVTRRLWAERAVRAVARAFPEVEFRHWNRCQRLLPQAQTCAELIQQFDFAFPEAIALLRRATSYLGERGQYPQAGLLLQQALAICERHYGAEDPAVADILDTLGANSYYQGDYPQAERLIQRAVDICEKAQGAERAKIVGILNNLAAVYNEQGKYAQSEPILLRAWSIAQETLALEDAATTGVLNNLGYLYYLQARYVESEPYYQRVLTIREQSLEPDHPEIILCLNNLAALYRVQGKYVEAEELFRRALTVREKILGPQHPDVAISLNNLAIVYLLLARYAEAEKLLLRAMNIRRRVLDAEHPDIADTLHALGRLYHARKQYSQAEDFFTQALAIRKKALGEDHPNVAQSLHNLATLYSDQGFYGQAKPLLEQSLEIRKKTLGTEHPDTASNQRDYDDLLRKMNPE